MSGASSSATSRTSVFGMFDTSESEDETPLAETAAVPAKPNLFASSGSDDDEESQLPPDGSVAGRWRDVAASASVLENALFCLEVHGEHVQGTR